MGEIKPGSVVKLISGGPSMTVAQIVGNDVLCAWFDTDGHGGWRFEQARISLWAVVICKDRG